jgi:hypothetical protein
MQQNNGSSYGRRPYKSRRIRKTVGVALIWAVTAAYELWEQCYFEARTLRSSLTVSL